MKIGDSVWFYGGRYGGRYWDSNPELKITGETSRSWLVGSYKLPKKAATEAEELGNYRMVKVSDCGYTHVRVFLSKESYDNEAWVDKNQYHIAEAVKVVSSDVLRRVAALIGYKERP